MYAQPEIYNVCTSLRELEQTCAVDHTCLLMGLIQQELLLPVLEKPGGDCQR